MSDYIDYCLKAATEEEMIAALDFARTDDENGAEIWLGSGSNYALDIIGDIVLEPAVFDENGDMITPAVMDGGFHVNIRTFGDFSHNLSAVVLDPQPNTPSRTFA